MKTFKIVDILRPGQFLARVKTRCGGAAAGAGPQGTQGLADEMTNIMGG